MSVGINAYEFVEGSSVSDVNLATLLGARARILSVHITGEGTGANTVVNLQRYNGTAHRTFHRRPVAGNNAANNDRVIEFRHPVPVETVAWDDNSGTPQLITWQMTLSITWTTLTNENVTIFYTKDSHGP